MTVTSGFTFTKIVFPQTLNYVTQNVTGYVLEVYKVKEALGLK